MDYYEFRDAIRSLGDVDAPVLTAYLDLTPAPDTGHPTAPAVFKKALAEAMASLDLRHGPAADSLAADAAAVEEAIASAVAEGAHGLAIVSSNDAGFRYELTSVHPFRNDVRVGSRPWMFELERHGFELDQPATVASVDHHSIHLVRIIHGEVAGQRHTEGDPHATSKRRGRTAVEGRGAAGRTFGGGHSKNRLERAVEEKRATAAREAAAELVSLAGANDIVIVAGIDSARAELLAHLPAAVVQRVLERPAAAPGEVERTAAEVAADLATSTQLDLGDRFASEILGGAHGENHVSGVATVVRALAIGRAATVVLHEDAVAHWGSAIDSRRHNGTADEGRFELMVRQADATGAEVLFSRLPELLEQHEGAVATTRW